jgi:hypothetical protein
MKMSRIILLCSVFMASPHPAFADQLDQLLKAPHILRNTRLEGRGHPDRAVSGDEVVREEV